jgi:hypothetical protein
VSETCKEAVEAAKHRLTLAVRDREAARSFLHKAYALSLQSEQSATQDLGRAAQVDAERVHKLRLVAGRIADDLVDELGAL